MKKLFYLFAFVALAIVGLNSCSGNSGDTPSDVVEMAFEKMQDGKYAEVVDLLVDKEGQPLNEDQKNMLKGMMGEKLKDQPKVASFEIVGETVAEDGNSAVVETTVTYEDGKTKTDKQKVVKGADGEWHLTMGK